MLPRFQAFGKSAVSAALLLAVCGAPAVLTTGCAASGQTAQQRKTERYKRKKAKTNHIPCPTKDC